MPDWLQPWLEPTFVVASVGALLGGLGLLATRLASTLPEVRATADWWDARRDRRHAADIGARQTIEPRPLAPALDAPVPHLRLTRGPARRSVRSAQLTLDLDDVP